MSLVHNMSIHTAEADKPRVESQHLMKELALKALKNIPGSAPLIKKHFSTDAITPELREPKPINLVMHLAHHR